MKVEIRLLSDAIFGNGTSIPGAEDIGLLCDGYGFPYYKGSTFKGLFREEYENYLYVCGKTDDEICIEVNDLFGEGGADNDSKRKLTFTDFELSGKVREAVLYETEAKAPERITEMFTHMRTFTKIDDDGMVQDGSLRKARCIDKGLCFYGDVKCAEEDSELLTEALGFIRFIGSMRNRGFGHVQVSVVKEVH